MGQEPPEIEVWRPGIVANLRSSNLYTEESKNYWAPFSSNSTEFQALDTDNRKEDKLCTQPEKGNKVALKWARKIQNRKLRKRKDPSAVLDSGATSNFWRNEDPHIKTGEKSDKLVIMPTGTTV